MAFAVSYDNSSGITSGQTADPAHINQNFTDIETELNDFPTDGTLANDAVSAAAQISDGIITTAKLASAAFKDEDDMASNLATAAASQQSVKAYVDAQVAATCADDGSTVFNASLTTANTWQDLDLSAKVGSNFALCFFEITESAGLGYVYKMKPKGYGSSTFANHTYGSNGQGTACSVDFSGTGKYIYWTCGTDTSGIVQIGSDSASSTLVIKLVGYVR